MARTRPEAVGTARFDPGRLTRGELVLGRHLGGPIASPVLVLCGARPGPTLWAQAAIHGGEIGGTLALARLLRRLDPTTVSGAIVAVLAANPLAFRAQTRNSPEDGENMNRLFPGDPQGSITRQMAHALLAAAEATADCVLDLHSGGVEAIVPFYALYWDDGSEAARLSAAYARSAGTEIVWTAQDSWLAGGMFGNVTRRGIPSVIVECGGGGSMPEIDIENFATAVTGVARAMSILPGGPVAQDRYRTIGSCDLVFADTPGFFEPAFSAGDTIATGEVLGRIIDAFGDERSSIVAKKTAYIAAIGRRYLPVNAGALLAELNDDHGWVAR